MAQEGGHGLGEPVGAGAAEGEEVAGLDFGEVDVAEAIKAGAEWTGQGGGAQVTGLPHGPHGEGLAGEEGAQEVVDTGFQKHEAGAPALLDPHHP